MKFVIVTGMSGSGKSEVMSILEDMGYYCIDNLPAELIPKIFELGAQSQANLQNVAIGLDARGYNFENSYAASIGFINEQNSPVEILFLDANDDVLIRRYKMTRKRHPLEKGGDVLSAIKKERELLQDIKAQSNITIDTSNLEIRHLKNKIQEIFSIGEKKHNMTVSISSFGFKHGIPMDADMVFDVRFLPNPYYNKDLKEKTGETQEVRDYVMNSPVSVEFLEKIISMVTFLLPNYEEEGKSHLHIAIGCTGGRHRSVTFVNLVFNALQNLEYNIVKNHRDIDKK